MDHAEIHSRYVRHLPSGRLLQQNLFPGAMKSTFQYAANGFLAGRITPLFPPSALIYVTGLFLLNKNVEKQKTDLLCNLKSYFM